MTHDLAMECARIQEQIPANSVDISISQQDWQQQWQKVKERTSSSESGIHFGHYKAGAKSDTISAFHALKSTLSLR